MLENSWFKEIPVTITACNREGMILAMNERSRKYFEKQGGEELIGKNLLDCHPPAARKKIEEMLEKQTSNCYTIQEKGKKKFIYQTPWYQEGIFMGITEMIFEVPPEIPNFVRK